MFWLELKILLLYLLWSHEFLKVYKTVKSQLRTIIVRLDRNRHSGGIIIYIHVSLNWEVLLRGPNNLEFIALSISPVFSNVKHCVSVLYRPPSSPVSFFDDFCNTLQHLSPHLFTSFMIVGDFNINFF